MINNKSLGGLILLASLVLELSVTPVFADNWTVTRR